MKLGFGLMRLPRLGDNAIDVEQVKNMVDRFMEAGGTYFDTAFVYEGSEEAIKAALVDRYPRESFTLATKLNAWLNCGSQEAAKKQIMTSLERTGAGYFDYYLLHSVRDSNVSIYDDYDLWNYVKQFKEEGLIKRYGFSFHDSPALLDALLTQHPDVDFVQLHINYADWDNADVASGGNYQVACRHHKPVIVMEPVKGGILANQQMEDNLSYMRDFKPLNDEEVEVIRQVQERLGHSDQIACTACKYCMPGCPMGIAIPKIFGSYNMLRTYGRRDLAVRQYKMLTNTSTLASACLECGQCERACPQHLPIMSHLKKAVAELEEQGD